MDRLANFCEVADVGSIVAAAKGDPSRQSLISRQIRELERFFGVDLVRRVGRGLALTEAGRELAAIGRQNFKGLADYFSRCQQREWTVRIVASNSVVQWLMLPRMKSVAAMHPLVRFAVFHEQTREMISGIREGRYDVGFVRRDALCHGLRHIALGEIRSCLFVPKSLSRTRPKNAAEALVRLPMALPVGGAVRESVDKLAASKGGVPRVTVACTSYLQAAEAVRSEVCAAVLPETAIVALDLRKVHRIDLTDKVTICLAWSPRNAETRTTLNELIATFGAQMRF